LDATVGLAELQPAASSAVAAMKAATVVFLILVSQR